mmetsp:Transcript_10039/g.15883  ORF Transcript_10039/g.15883 Transcript_10039/m.15883 type:complete len:141 (-) Transcript_10039:43-465(-)
MERACPRRLPTWMVVSMLTAHGSQSQISLGCGMNPDADGMREFTDFIMEASASYSSMPPAHTRSSTCPTILSPSRGRNSGGLCGKECNYLVLCRHKFVAYIPPQKLTQTHTHGHEQAPRGAQVRKDVEGAQNMCNAGRSS